MRGQVSIGPAYQGRDGSERIDMGQPENRSVRQIEEEIEQTRTQLASTIDQLVYRTKPATIVQRSKDQAVDTLREATYTPDGQLRTERVAIAAAVVVALIGLAIYRRTRG